MWLPCIARMELSLAKEIFLTDLKLRSAEPFLLQILHMKRFVQSALALLDHCIPMQIYLLFLSEVSGLVLPDLRDIISNAW